LCKHSRIVKICWLVLMILVFHVKFFCLLLFCFNLYSFHMWLYVTSARPIVSFLLWTNHLLRIEIKAVFFLIRDWEKFIDTFEVPRGTISSLFFSAAGICYGNTSRRPQVTMGRAVGPELLARFYTQTECRMVRNSAHYAAFTTSPLYNRWTSSTRCALHMELCSSWRHVGAVVVVRRPMHPLP
jgi:hypothetical protein